MNSLQTREPWWYNRRNLTILALALALIGGVSWRVWVSTHCAPGIRRLGGECIGVTDGGFVFSPELAKALGKIEAENRRVAQTGKPYVSIAYLVSLPTKADQDPSLFEIQRHELQGAHLAQLRANRTNELGDQPLIRLLVANAGEESEQWQPVVGQLLAKVGSPDRLVAVAGLGESRAATQEVVVRLTAGGLPVIAARVAADSIGGQPGFARVSVTSSNQAKAAVAYLRKDPEVHRVMLISDVSRTDTFSTELAAAFTREAGVAGLTLLQPVEEYDSSQPGVANRFTDMLSSVCLHKPDVVYFAGRGNDLDAFVEALPGRPCLDTPINIMTGGSGSRTAIILGQEIKAHKDSLQRGLNANAALLYTPQAHPGAWAAAPGAFRPEPIRLFQQQCEDCFASLFPQESLDDGGAIMGNDAVVTAVTAIRKAAGSRDLGEEPISPGEVIQALRGLHDLDAVPGASGWISLGNDGNPTDKAVPIIQLHPDASIELLAVSSPNAAGAPFTPPRSS